MEDRLRKHTEDNRELANNLRREAEASFRLKNTKTTAKKRAGSDRDSVRDSEERGSVPGRGTKRARDSEIEKVYTYRRNLLNLVAMEPKKEIFTKGTISFMITY